MKLSGRLSMIADKIPSCDMLIDIGTDHGYIPIYAIKNNICKKSIASDLREGPLKVAQRNIIRNGVEKNIEVRQGNGLERISLSECDVIVIAGMGGTLIRDLLCDSIEKARKANMLLLQPNSASDALRKWLYESGFEITDEALSFDAGKFYCIISAKWSGVVQKMDFTDYYLGAKLLSSGDSLLSDYLRKKLHGLNVIINGRKKSEALKKGKGFDESGISTDDCIIIRDFIVEYLKDKANKNSILKGEN